MYTQAQGRTYQASPNCTCCICYVTLLALQKSTELAVHCTVSRYDICCLWLWVCNSNVSMVFFKIHSVM